MINTGVTAFRFHLHIFIVQKHLITELTKLRLFSFTEPHTGRETKPVRRFFLFTSPRLNVVKDIAAQCMPAPQPELQKSKSTSMFLWKMQPFIFMNAIENRDEVKFD